METIDRRMFILGVGAATLAVPAAGLAQPSRLTMWKDPSCGCCGAWADRVQSALGERMTVVPTADMAAVKRARGVPEDLWSCHTASIHGIVVEGHVPPADIQRLMRGRDRGVRGLAVPGMPAGAPGMDVGHSRRDAYQVIAFGAGALRSVYASYG
jgi:hypothetical protein